MRLRSVSSFMYLRWASWEAGLWHCYNGLKGDGLIETYAREACHFTPAGTYCVGTFNAPAKLVRMDELCVAMERTKR